MGFDVEAETVRVLDAGLPELPARLEPGQIVAVALWRGERHGAVLFARARKDGEFARECAISERAPGGAWELPSGSGGGPWIGDPLVRRESGWGGWPIAWLGESGRGDVLAVQAAASARVGSIRVEQAGRVSMVPVDSPCGAVVVVVDSSDGPATLQPVDAAGRMLTGASGEPAARTV